MTHSQGKLLVGILPALQPVYFKIEKVNFSVMYLNLPTLLLSMTKWQKFFQCSDRGNIYRGRQRRFTTNLCCLSHGCSLSLHPPPPSLQGCQAREVGETEKDRERRKKDRKDSRNKSTNSLNPCYPVLASQL